MKRIIPFIIPVVLGFLVGMSARYFQAETLYTWYPTLNMSLFTPPDIVFPIAWAIIYLCSGLSMGIIWNTKSIARGPMSLIFGTQLFLNFMWSYGFFYLMNPATALATIIFLDVFVIYYMWRAIDISRVATWLFAPYAAWLNLATYLNAYVVIFN